MGRLMRLWTLLGDVLAWLSTNAGGLYQLWLWLTKQPDERAYLGTPRVAGWAKLAKVHLRVYPACQVCGRRTNVVPHHKLPVSFRPDLELDPDNLVTLCNGHRSFGGCHQWVGHLGDPHSYNPDVMPDIDIWREKMAAKPRR